MEQKKIYGIRRDILLVAAALVVTGIIFLAFPGTSAVTICYIFAGAICLWGAFRILSYFRMSRLSIFGSYGLVQGAALLMVGTFIFIKPQFLASVLVSVIGIVMIADGFLKLQHSVDLLRIKSPKWIILLGLAVVMIIAGVVVLFNPFKTAEVLMRFAGIVLIIEGVTDLASVILISRRIKAIKKAMEEDVEVENYPTYDAEYTEEQ